MNRTVAMGLAIGILFAAATAGFARTELPAGAKSAADNASENKAKTAQDQETPVWLYFAIGGGVIVLLILAAWIIFKPKGPQMVGRSHHRSSPPPTDWSD